MASRTPLPRVLRGRSFTIAEARAAGLGRGRLRGRDLHAPFSGIRMPAARERTVSALAFALQRRLPETAFFSGITAAVVMGVPLPRHLEESTTLHVSVPAPLAAPCRNGVVGHSVTVAGRHTTRRLGIRVSAPARLWCELAEVLDIPDLVAAGDFLIRRRRPEASIEDLRREVERSTRRRGNKKLLAALELLDDGSESRRESLLRVIIVTAGMDAVTTTLEVTTSGGFDCRLDLAFVEKKVAVEFQSDLHHSDPRARRRDMTRRSRLEADGWFVIEVNADDLAHPEELVQRIRKVLASREVV